MTAEIVVGDERRELDLLVKNVRTFDDPKAIKGADRRAIAQAQAEGRIAGALDLRDDDGVAIDVLMHQFRGKIVRWPPPDRRPPAAGQITRFLAGIDTAGLVAIGCIIDASQSNGELVLDDRNVDHSLGIDQAGV